MSGERGTTTEPSKAPRALERWLAPLCVLAVQAAGCWLSLSAGPITISDDDYARVTIAQRFAEVPSLDPTGTSWLPLPFYLQGTALALTDGSLAAARAFQVLLALGSALLLYLAGTWLAERRVFAAFGAILGLCIPYVSQLAVATVPEFQTATLACLGLAGLTQVPESFSGAGERILVGRRLCSALALTAACACRYEAWWLALAAMLFTLDDARRAHRLGRAALARSLVGIALLHVTFPVIWLTHGAVNHGSATFFIARVTAYKHALGEAARPLSELLTEGYLGSAFTFAPGAILAPVLLAVWLRRTDVRALLRPVLALGFMLLLLTLSELRGGAPTHHAERTVVAVWLFGALATGALFARVTAAMQRSRVIAGAVAISLLFTLSAAAARTPAPFVDRSAEERLGQAIPKDARVVIATSDYGYFAVMAAAGAPSRFFVVDTNDPRNSKSTESLTERALRMASEHHATHLVLPTTEAPPPFGQTLQIGALKLYSAPH